MSPLYPLLALIARADAYGYELKRAIDMEFAPEWAVDFAQLYRTLAKLRSLEFVRVRPAPHSGGPPRRVYSITPRGKRALVKWFQLPADSPDEHRVKIRLAASLALESGMPLVISGSDDPLLAYLARHAHAHTDIIGSTSGLVNLAANKAEIIGTHLRDPGADEFNVSFVRHLVTEQDILLVNLAVREYGLLVAADNPAKINHIRDLARTGIRLVNRSPGSGARLWLQRHLRAEQIDPTAVSGWQSGVSTYDSLAHAIKNGTADVGPGLRATAAKFGLHFVPLGQERFDLAIPRPLFETPRVQDLLHTMFTADYHHITSTFAGYDLSRSGRIIARIKFGEIQ